MGLARTGLSWALLSLSTGLGACQPKCVGAGCEESYDAALAGVLDGASQPEEGIRSPLSTWVSVSGGGEQGSAWDVTLTTTGLLVGSPADGHVRRYLLSRGDSLGVDDAVGSILGDHTGDEFGATVAAHMNPDGTLDLLVGAPAQDRSGTSRDEGAVHVFLDLDPDLRGEAASGDLRQARVMGQNVGGAFGEQLAWCEDIDGDGQADWIGAAPLDDAGDTPLAGRVFLVSSGTAPIGESEVESLAVQWSGGNHGARAGTALRCSEDLTGDGVADVLIGAPFADGAHEAEGALYLIPGADPMPGGVLEDVAARVFTGRIAEAWLGRSVATGDLDGDDLPDLAIGAPGAWDGAGEVLVWLNPSVRDPSQPPADFRLQGDTAGDRFGTTLAIADQDGDGLSDLIVGAPRVNPNDTAQAFDSGTLYVFRGDQALHGWRANMQAGSAPLQYVLPQQYLRTGQRMHTGDFDSDGLADIALVNQQLAR